MAEEKMVDLDTSGEGQEVELPQEESTENKEVEKKVEEKTNEEETDKKEEINEDESKDDGLDKYSNFPTIYFDSRSSVSCKNHPISFFTPRSIRKFCFV